MTGLSSAPGAASVAAQVASRASAQPPGPGWALAACLLLTLAGCSTAPTGQAPAAPPLERSAPATPATAPDTAVTPATPASTDMAAVDPPPPGRSRALWIPADWAALPGWGDDRAAEVWPALQAGCQRPAPRWAALCRRLAGFTPPDDSFARDFLQRELQPYRLAAADGQDQGLATGYFEPLINASRVARPGFGVPLYRPPADVQQRRPWYTRQEADTLPAAVAALRGLEIAWVASPLDALLLQIQGSGRLNVTERDGSQRLVRVAFAAHNDQPYRSVGRWLIERGELKPEGANWPAIRDWGQRAAPAQRNAMLWSNPRLVFFREEPLLDPNQGPRGAQGVPLTAGRSVAVDPTTLPYGTPMWLDTTEPLSATPLRRLVVAQDTGSAITGAVRIDLFWGWGDAAEQQAGRMKQPLRVWALWPRDDKP